MKLFAMLLTVSLLTLTNNIHAQETEKSQAEYDKEVAESLQEMTTQLQNISNDIIKYMNAMNKALEETMPQMTEDVGKIISSMKPLADTMQKNVDNFTKEINEQLDVYELENDPDYPEVAPAKPALAIDDISTPSASPSIFEPQDLSSAIDKELAQFQATPTPQRKIKLFLSSVE